MGRAPAPSRTPDRTAAEPPPEAVLREHIDRGRRRLMTQAALRQCVQVLAWGAIVPLLVVAADHAWPHGLPRAVLSVVAVTWLWALPVLAALLAGRAVLRRLNPVFVAQLLESCGGIRHNALVNALLIHDHPEDAYAGQAATRQAAAALRARPPAFASERGAWGRPLASCAVVLALWLFYGLISPKAIGPSLARFSGANWAAPTATQMEWIHPDAGEVVHAGDQLRIEVAVHGRTPGTVLFNVLPPGQTAAAPLAAHEMRRAAGGPTDRWQLTLAPHEVTGDIRYRCAANDAALEGTIPVLPRPDLAALEIILEPPPYTGWPPRSVSQPDLDVLVGTQATWRLRANTEVSDPVFVLVGERETRTRMVVDAAAADCFGISLPLLQGGAYRIEFADRYGYPCPNPPLQKIVVRPDETPAVEIILPAPESTPDDVADVTQHPWLVAQATDDVRVEALTLIREPDGLAEANSLPTAIAADGRAARLRVATGPLVPRPGDQARVWCEARDNRVQPDGLPAPQTGRSRVLTLRRPIDAPPAEPEPAARATVRVPSSKPADAEGPPDGESEPTATQPAGDSSSNTQPETQPGDQTGAASESETSGDKAHGELEGFVRQHGDKAREVVGRLRPEPQGQEQPDKPESQGSQETGPDGPGQGDNASAGGDEQEQPGPATGRGQGEPSGRSDESRQQGSDQNPRPQPPAEPAEPQPGANAEPGSPDGTTPAGAVGGQGASDGQPPGGQPPPAKDTPPDSATPPTGEPLEPDGLTATLDLLGMLHRGAEIGEDTLIEMGWAPPEAAAFVKALRRVYDTVQASGQLDELLRVRFPTQLGNGDVQPGEGLAADLDTRVEAAAGPKDDLGQTGPTREQRVPAHLRAILDAYYRSMAERDARERR